MYFFSRHLGVFSEASSNRVSVHVAFLAAHFMCFFNSAINPVLYNFLSGKSPFISILSI